MNENRQEIMSPEEYTNRILELSGMWDGGLPASITWRTWSEHLLST